SGGYQYRNTAKAQIFLNGLRPEYILAIAPSTSNTLQSVYEYAKAYKVLVSKPHLSMSNGFQPPVSAFELAIEKLAKAVNKMLIQFQERRPLLQETSIDLYIISVIG
ncbi:7363_t:CDS:2, partial [Racocetra fulgida]